jgi:hypothetical protein
MRRPYIVGAIVFVALAGAWHFWLGARWTMRIGPHWSLSTKYVGTQTDADPQTGILPAKDQFGTYVRSIRVTDASDWPRTVLLEDRYTVRHMSKGTAIFDHTTHERVDPQTGAWAAGPHKGEIVVFPRHVERRTYVMRSNYLESVPLAFAGTDRVGGIDTYLFAYRGRGEYTAAYKGTSEYPGLTVKPGQEIRCADDQFYYRIWVEPTTGALVKVEEGCPAGDFVYDIATKARLAAVDRWSGVAAGADLARRIAEVHDLRRAFLLSSRYFPGTLLAISLLLLILGVRPRSERLAT